ncbi:MAG: S-layer homology domain-containing protein [Clostridiales bacterium]|nr:S-layer homology domain-containing protein [Clostridiales bacterium]
MSKKVLLYLLALVMVLSAVGIMMPMVSAAVVSADYTLFLHTDGTLHENSSGGADITAEMELEGMAVDGSAGAWVLTLSDFDYVTTAATALSVPAGTAIVLVGDNQITVVNEGALLSYGIYSAGALTITSVSEGNLTVTGGDATDNDSYGIFTNAGGITVNGSAALIAGGGGVAGDGNRYSYGMRSAGAITVSGDAVVSAEGGGAAGGDAANNTGYSYGIYSNSGGISVAGSALVAGRGGAAAGGSNNGRAYSYGIVANSGTVTVSGNAQLTAIGGGTAVTAASNGVGYSYGITATNITLSDNAVISAEGGDASGGGYNYSGNSYGLSAGTGLAVSDSAVINAAGSDMNAGNGNANSYGVYCGNDITISGSTAINTTGGDITAVSGDAGSYGIYCGNEMTISDGATISSNSGNLNVGKNGVSRAIYGHTVIISANATVTAEAGNVTSAINSSPNGNEISGIRAYDLSISGDANVIARTGVLTAFGGSNWAITGNIIVSGGTVTTSGAACGINGTLNCSGGVINASGRITGIAGNLIISGDAEVNAATTDGTAYYSYAIDGNVDISGGTLNAEGGEAVSGSSAIYQYGSSGSIKISGGTVKATGGEAPESSFGINATKLEISGGTLKATGEDANGYSSGIFTAYLDISGGIINAAGGSSGNDNSYGIYAGGYTESYLILSDGIITAKGETRAIRGPYYETDYNFTVPNGYAYTVAADTANTSGTASGRSTKTNPFIITSAHKYAKIEPDIQAYTLYLNNADGKLLQGEGGADITAEAAAWGAAANGDTDAWTLTLKDFIFATGAAEALQVPGGTTIVLDGDNRIINTFNDSSDLYGIYSEGALTVTSASGGSLITASGTTDGSNGNCGIYSLGSVLITGNAVITAVGGSGGNSMGISTDSGSDITISENANLTAVGGNADSSSYGISSSGGISISGGTLTAMAGSASSQSCGVFANDGFIINGGIATARGESLAIYSGPSGNYTVPDGWYYAVSAAADGSNPAIGKGDGSFEITSAHKYAKIAGDSIIHLDEISPTGGDGWTYSSNVFTVDGTADVIITGATADRWVVVSADANITLDNANIQISDKAPIDCGANTVNITLVGTNVLIVSGWANKYAALQANDGHIIIDGADSAVLTAESIGPSSGGGSAYNNGAGIGGGDNGSSTVTINGGTVNAASRGGWANSAGIGGGYSGDGTVSINGGTLNAVGGNDRAGIGGGYSGSGIVTISGGTVNTEYYLGGGSYSGGGTVTISGGIVNVGGIGGNLYADSTVNISGGTVEAGFISSYRGDAEINISGGTVSAATIGKNNWHGVGNVTITISGGMVTATGSSSSIGIGRGEASSGDITDITISGGTVYASLIGNAATAGDAVITISGGSVNSGVTTTPTNGTASVYLNKLTVGSAANANKPVTAGSLKGVAMAETPDPAAGVYGIKDTVTDGSGKVYFWLPLSGNSGADKETVSLTVGGDEYSADYARTSAGNTKTLSLPGLLSTDAGITAIAGQVITWGGGDGSDETRPLTASINVANSVTAITAANITRAAGSTVVVSGGALSPGVNTVKIEVTAEDGLTKLYYKVSVTRAILSTDAGITAIAGQTTTWGGGNGSDETRPLTASINVANSVTVITAANITRAAGSTVVVSGGTLSVGANTVKIEVTAEDGLTKLYYEVSITRAGGGDGGTVTYTVTFNTNGGSAVPSATVVQNGKVTKPADPAKEGFRFDGWYADQALTTEYDFDTAVTGNITLYAKWTEKEGTSEWQNPFTDVKAGDWFFDDVKFVQENGLFYGVSETEFAPGEAMTRAMIATVLYRHSGSPSVSGLTIPFDDVPAGQWYTDAIKWAFAGNIIYGYSSSKYGPDDIVTREQLAVILWRYEGEPAGTGDLGRFSDSGSISNWAAKAMKWADGAGLINGYPDGTVRPQGMANRAEVAAIIQRLIAE